MRNRISGAADRTNLELPPASSILDELEEWEQYLKAERIDIHILEHFGECEDIEADATKREQLSSENQAVKRHRPLRRFRGPSL